jgi:hypothetical protein
MFRVDADHGEALHDVGGGVDVGVDGAGDRAVVLERGDCDFGQGVDGVGVGEAVDARWVGKRGVLRGRRCSQWTLRMRAVGGEAFPPFAVEPGTEEPVGELGLGDRRPAAQLERVGGSDGVMQRRSTSVSTRSTTNDATLCTDARSPPEAASFSGPDG